MILERVRKKREKYLQSVIVTNTWDLIKDKRPFYLGVLKNVWVFQGFSVKASVAVPAEIIICPNAK